MAIHLAEFLADMLHIGFGNANARIAYIHLHPRAIGLFRIAPTHRDAARFGKLDGIVHEVTHNLEHGRTIGHHKRFLAAFVMEVEPLWHDNRMHIIGFVHQLFHRLLREFKRERFFLLGGIVHHIIEQTQELIFAVVDMMRKS